MKRIKVKKTLLKRGLLQKYRYLFFALAKNDYFCMRMYYTYGMYSSRSNELIKE
jgi:hypothetical protein